MPEPIVYPAIGPLAPTKLSHEDLRKRAVKWLTNTKRCSVVLSEMVTAAWETPDAIGWKGAGSILVECKVSRADFFRNADKPSVRAGRCMGTQRFFLVPHGLVAKSDMERFPDYGLMSVGESGNIQVITEAPHRTSNERSEIAMLVSALRRVRTREYLTIMVDSPLLSIDEPPETILRATYFGYVVVCTTCRHTKKPWGRSAPMEMVLCSHECHGYAQEPLPSELWPHESEADFGYKVSR